MVLSQTRQQRPAFVTCPARAVADQEGRGDPGAENAVFGRARDYEVLCDQEVRSLRAGLPGLPVRRVPPARGLAGALYGAQPASGSQPIGNLLGTELEPDAPPHDGVEDVSPIPSAFLWPQHPLFSVPLSAYRNQDGAKVPFSEEEDKEDLLGEVDYEEFERADIDQDPDTDSYAGIDDDLATDHGDQRAQGKCLLISASGNAAMLSRGFVLLDTHMKEARQARFFASATGTYFGKEISISTWRHIASWIVDNLPEDVKQYLLDR